MRHFRNEFYTAQYVKPLDSENEQLLTENLNQISTDADHAVFAFSYTPDQNVYASANGTIVEMRHVVPSDCDPNFNRADNLFNSHPCMLLIPDSDQSYFLSGGRNETADGSNTWVVRLLSESGIEFTYFVDTADRYLTEGQTVSAGCIMGKTMRIDTGETPATYLDEPGMAIVVVRESGTIVDSLASFNIEPGTSQACNINPENANCMGDVQLNDPAAWRTSSGVVFNDPGYTLLGGFNAYIRTTMNLDAAQEPELIVYARASGGGNGNLILTIGQTTTPFSISEAAGFQRMSIAGATHQPDGSFYTIRVMNDGTSTIDIQSICVRFTKNEEGEPIENPPPKPPPEQQTCAFADNSFNQGSTSWSVSLGEFGPGEVRLQNTGTVS